MNKYIVKSIKLGPVPFDGNHFNERIVNADNFKITDNGDLIFFEMTGNHGTAAAIKAFAKGFWSEVEFKESV